jgi:hypothetical protein
VLVNPCVGYFKKTKEHKMGMDLVSVKGDDNDDEKYFYFDIFGWSKILELANSYGWKPFGTELGLWCLEDGTPIMPFPDEWDGDYFSNGGQGITAEDASAIADALESALDDIPDCDGLAPKHLTLSTAEEVHGYIRALDEPQIKSVLMLDIFDTPDSIVVPNSMVSTIEYFSGYRKEQVMDFIAFCRRGRFYIW